MEMALPGGPGTRTSYACSEKAAAERDEELDTSRSRCSLPVQQTPAGAGIRDGRVTAAPRRRGRSPPARGSGRAPIGAGAGAGRRRSGRPGLRRGSPRRRRERAGVGVAQFQGRGGANPEAGRLAGA